MNKLVELNHCHMMLIPLLRIFSVLQIAIGVACIVIQAIITAQYSDCFPSKMGCGIWMGFLSMCAGICIALNTRRSHQAQSKPSLWTVVFCAMTFLASLVLIGVASGVIYQIKSLDYFQMGDFIDEIKERAKKELPREPTKWFETFLNPNQILGSMGNQVLGTVATNAKYRMQINSCFNSEYNPLNPLVWDNDDRNARIGLEGALLALAIVSMIVDLIAILVLRMTDATSSSNVFIINNQKSIIQGHTQLQEIHSANKA